MVPILQRFGHYLLSRNAKGEVVELQRCKKERVFLAFDTKTKRLVELHVLKSGVAMDAAEKRSAMERAAQAMDVRGASFMRVIEVSEETGVVYFASNLSDGEFAEEYVTRRGALPAVMVFCLMQHLLDDLVAAQGFGRLISRVQVANPLVTTLEDAFLQLRIIDYGLSEREQMSAETSLKRVFVDCCRLLFLLLTGQAYEGQNPDRFPVLTSLPTNLRANLRLALATPQDASPNIERLRDDVREAYAALVPNLQSRNSRKHIAVSDGVQPMSSLQQVLLENVSAEELLRGRFDVSQGEDTRHYPFAIPATSAKNQQSVTVHLLPPSRIVERGQIEPVPLQMWRFNEDRHPNIVRSLSLWESPEWTFLTEEREPGFTLSRLMAERGSFNPPEVLAILKQVRAGLDQASECGVQSVDLHPSNLVFRVGKGGAMQAREFEKLVMKRIDAWPPFILKLRPHMTMRSLYEPLLVEPHPDSVSRDWHLVSSDLRCRSFVGLAIYLLTGERQVGSAPVFGENVPETLAAYLKECLEAQKNFGGAPQPGQFIDAFEGLMSHEDAEGRGFSAIRNASKVPVEDMESAGAVSDFDNEWGSNSDGLDYLVKPSSKKLSVGTLPAHKEVDRGALGMLVWAAMSLVLIVAAWMLLGLGKSSTQTAENNALDNKTQPFSIREEVRKAVKATRADIEKALREYRGEPVPPKTPSNAPGDVGLVESANNLGKPR